MLESVWAPKEIENTVLGLQELRSGEWLSLVKYPENYSKKIHSCMYAVNKY